MTNETDTNTEFGNSTAKPTGTDLRRYEKLKLWVTQNKFKSCLLVVIVLMFFSRDWDGKFSWKEEVQLPDGEIIMVKRWVDSSWSQAIGGTGAHSLKGGRMEVLSDIADKPGVWEFPALPVLLFRDPTDKVWTTVATWPSSVGGRHFKRAPGTKHWYVMHRYVDGKWIEIDMDLSLIERRVPLNLIREIDFYRGMSSLSLSEKQKLFAESKRYPHKCLTVKDPIFYKSCETKITSNVF